MLFLSTIKCDRLLENGVTKTVTEQHLIQANSYTEAEARITEEMINNGATEFSIHSIKAPKVNEFIHGQNQENTMLYFNAKTKYTTLDGNSAKETTKTHAYIIEAHNFNHAYTLLCDAISRSALMEEIASLTLSPIVDYYD